METQGDREGTVEKRLRGDRKYRRVCTLDSGIHNSRFTSFSWRAVSPFRDPKNKKAKKENDIRTLYSLGERVYAIGNS